MTAPRTSPYAPHGTRLPMHVTVRTADGKQREYDALFAHTFDAYDDAMERFGLDAVRIVVKATPPGAQTS